ncbi:hypothetical protein EDB85DRAFT_1895386 [Lactarius pseudohatsudake]|nr:hypothetical protein EDB85DRAFT_1895386 [Lactarius pseudohatsudake]
MSQLAHLSSPSRSLAPLLALPSRAIIERPHHKVLCLSRQQKYTFGQRLNLRPVQRSPDREISAKSMQLVLVKLECVTAGNDMKRGTGQTFILLRNSCSDAQLSYPNHLKTRESRWSTTTRSCYTTRINGYIVARNHATTKHEYLACIWHPVSSLGQDLQEAPNTDRLAKSLPSPVTLHILSDSSSTLLWPLCGKTFVTTWIDIVHRRIYAERKPPGRT